MLKVLIADDEQLICRMLEKMIDWKSKNLEIVGLVNNGLEVLEKMEEWNPDIVITDICMPGADGLQLVQKVKETGKAVDFIIMSGYKNFEYAHTALNLGVKHYLLKPINKKELDEILERILAERINQAVNKEKIVELEERANLGTKKIRKHFLSNIIRNNVYTKPMVENIGQLELASQEVLDNCEFGKECFRVFLTKVDTDKPNCDMKTLLNAVDYLIEKEMQDKPWEYINSYVNSGVVTVINYQEEQRETVRKGILNILNHCKMELDKFLGFYVTIGIGNEKYLITEIQDSVKEAIMSIQCRLKKGLDRIIHYDELNYRSIELGEIYNFAQQQEIENMIEAIDANAYIQKYIQICGLVNEIPNHSPVLIFELIETLHKQILKIWQENHIPEELCKDFEKEIQYILDFNITEELMENSFSDDIRIYFERVGRENQKKSQFPIRRAKQYIQQNYANAITLEEVAGAISLSPAYLSTVFKKEIGIKFSDYLVSCRMEEAKRLLKSSNEPIAVISEKVGYIDSKYFSRIFYKIIGLKPSEYRKLYR